MSYRDIEELMAGRDVEVDHSTVNRWVRQATLAGVELHRMLRKGQYRYGGGLTVFEQFYALAG